MTNHGRFTAGRGSRAVLALAVLALWLAPLSGCAGPIAGAGDPLTHPDAVRLQDSGLAAEILPRLDRVTYFGPAGGPNMLFVTGLDREPDGGGGYTFYGGAYTWVSPQADELGWRDEAGAERDWMLDTAMDRGPARVLRATDDEAVFLTPESRAGLRERKTLRLTGPRTAEFVYELENLTGEWLRRGTWTNTAVGADWRIAVRLPNAEVWGWNDESIAQMRSLVAQEHDGWARLDVGRGSWDGGGKTYLDSTPEIAIWTDGWWLHRRILEPVDAAALRAVDEGPVALYIDVPDAPGDTPVIEAELYGPLLEVPAYGSITTTETWTLIRSPGGTLEELTRGLD